MRAERATVQTPRADGPEPDPTTTRAAPRWFELIPVAAACSVAAIGLVGLVLAMLDVFSTPAAVVLGGPLAAAAVVAVHAAIGRTNDSSDGPVRPEGPSGRRRWGPATLGAVGALVCAGSFLATAARAPSEHVLVNRDPGSYVTTARSLSGTGSLRVDAAVGGLDAASELRFGSYAVYDEGDGALEFQFGHLTSVVAAVAYDLGGEWLLFRLPAIVVASGLLALYAVTVRVIRRPYLALLVPVALGVAMPVVAVARDMYSEAFTLLPLWAALLVGLVLHDRTRLGAALVAGGLLGATVAARVDSMVYLAAAAPLLAVFIGSAADRPTRTARLRASAAVVGSWAAATAVGLVDLHRFGGRYVAQHAAQVGALRLAVLAVVVVSAAGLATWSAVPWVRDRLRREVPRCAPWAAGGVVAVLAAGWLVRPHVQVARGAISVPLVAGLQASEGVPVDGTRTYAELSLQWASWYLGPVALVLGIGGLAWTVARAARGRATPGAVVVAVLLGVTGALYWWQPSIVPDHIWAMRRFVPAILPALAVMVALALGSLAAAPRLRAPLRPALVGVLAILVVVPPAAITWPVRHLREQHGHLAVLLEACDLIGTEGSVLVVDPQMADVLPQALRSWCGVPVASATDALTPVGLERLRASVDDEGRVLVLVAADREALAAALPEGIPVVRTSVVVEERQAERTLLRPPAAYRPGGEGWALHVAHVTGRPGTPAGSRDRSGS